MNLQTGKPTMDGMYLVFVPAIMKGWLEPQIVAWHDGAWHHRWSKQKYQDNVQYWRGPLPVLRNESAPLPKPPVPSIFNEPEAPSAPPPPAPQELPCEHDNMVLQHTGDGTPVNFCPDCGVNFIITGNRLDYDL